MIKFLLGLIVGICLILGAGYLFATRGGIFMGTAGGPLPLERSIANKALDSSIGKSSQDQSPLPADETNLLAGAHVYMRGCAGCHGMLNASSSALGPRVYPHPPLLLSGKGVTDDPVGTTHWVVKNGIRFSAMPSSGKLSEDEIWQVSLFLHNADKLPASVQEALRPAQPN